MKHTRNRFLKGIRSMSLEQLRKELNRLKTELMSYSVYGEVGMTHRIPTSSIA